MIDRARLVGHVRPGAAQHAACAPSRNQSFIPKMGHPQGGQSRRADGANFTRTRGQGSQEAGVDRRFALSMSAPF
jgi:hypothetical protein